MSTSRRRQLSSGRALVQANSTRDLLECSPPSHKDTIGPKTPVKDSPKRGTPYYRYFTKPYPKQEIYLTPELNAINQTQIEPYIKRLFPTNLQWFSDDLKKDLEFYEFILVNSGSVAIYHTISEDKTCISFSRCKILKVLTADDWVNQSDLKPFTIPNQDPQGYSYTDYKNAWAYTFLLRPFSHSWFFFFDRGCNDNLPIWFYHWWFHFGTTTDIYPDQIRPAFEYYMNHSPDKLFTRPLRFHRDTTLAWILCWAYETIQTLPKPFPLTLCRRFKIRWWEKFDLSTLTVHKVHGILCTKKSNYKPPITTINTVPKMVPDTASSSSAHPKAQEAKLKE